MAFGISGVRSANGELRSFSIVEPGAPVGKGSVARISATRRAIFVEWPALAESMLDQAALKEFSNKNKNGRARRQARGCAHLSNVIQMSQFWACNFVAADRKMIRYRSRRPPDVELRPRLRYLANQRRRFGYRRLFILLREQGEPSGMTRIYRLYREEGLTVRKRKARRRAVGTRTRSWSRPSLMRAGRLILCTIVRPGPALPHSQHRR